MAYKCRYIRIGLTNAVLAQRRVAMQAAAGGVADAVECAAGGARGDEGVLPMDGVETGGGLLDRDVEAAALDARAKTKFEAALHKLLEAQREKEKAEARESDEVWTWAYTPL